MNSTEKTLLANSLAGAPPKPATSKTKLIIAASLGNFLEFFDFTVYSFFVLQIGKLFFEAAPGGQTMAAVMTFGIGFLMRPIGSIVLGGYADRHGRKAALLITILFMAIGSALIAFAPTYETIGILAPLLIILGRLLQGFSAGGEIGAATTLLLESARPEQRGFFISWQYVTQSMSSLVGSLFGAGLSYFLTQEQLLSWGWRIPFIFSLLIIPAGLYIRAHIQETHIAVDHKQKHPLLEVIAAHFRQFVLATFMIMPTTVVVYIMIFYMKTYLSLATAIPESSAYLFTTGSSVIMLIFALIGGFLGDRIKQRKLLNISFLAIILMTSFLFYSNINNNLALAIPALAVTFMVFGMQMTIQTLMVIEAFPRSVRATAMAVSYSVGVMIFGGTAQIIVTKLMNSSNNNPMAPFWYLGLIMVLGMIIYSFFQEERHE